MASLLPRLRASVCSPAYIAIRYRGTGIRSGDLLSLFLQGCILWRLILHRLHCYGKGNSFFRFHRISHNAPPGCSKSHISRPINSFPAAPGGYLRNSLLSQDCSHQVALTFQATSKNYPAQELPAQDVWFSALALPWLSASVQRGKAGYSSKVRSQLRAAVVSLPFPGQTFLPGSPPVS